MKKILIFSIMFLFISTINSKAQIDMSIYGGLSTPDEDMSYVYNEDQNIWDFAGKGIDVGWHFGARIRYEINHGFFFFAGFAWNRFSDAQLEIKNINNDTTYSISAKQDILPIGVGLQYYITKKVVRFYVIGQLNYNYFTTHGQYMDLPAPNFDLSVASSRGGFQVGTGVVFNFVLVYPFIEFSYSMPNIVGKVDDEPTKQFFNLSIGINM